MSASEPDRQLCHPGDHQSDYFRRFTQRSGDSPVGLRLDSAYVHPEKGPTGTDVLSSRTLAKQGPARGTEVTYEARAITGAVRNKASEQLGAVTGEHRV